MAQAPVISIVLPVYNRDASLRRAIASVLNQTNESFECIVVDDASSRDIGALVASYSDRRLRLVRRDTNGGPYAARFTGMMAMRGKYAMFLDSDHEFYPWALAQAQRYLDATSEVDLVCALHLRHEDSRLFVRVRDAPKIVTPFDARSEPPIPDRVAAVRRCVVDEWLTKRSDYYAFEVHLFLTTSLRHAALYVDEPWTLYHRDGEDRVSLRTSDPRRLDDNVRFLNEHWDLIEAAGPWLLLDEVLKGIYFALWRARRPEAVQAARALSLRGVTPSRALLDVIRRKARGKTRGNALEAEAITWV